MWQISKKSTIFIGVFIIVSICLIISYPKNFSQAQEIVVTYDEGTAPEACSPGEVAQILLDFTEAISKNNHEQIVPILNSEYFQWYSVGNEFSSRNQPRTALYDYWNKRHDNHEVIVLRQVSSSYQGGQRDQANAIFVIEIRADDFVQKYGIDSFRVAGKSAVKCTDGARSLIVWSMPSPQNIIDNNYDEPQLCPLPTQLISDKAVLACSTKPLSMAH